MPLTFSFTPRRTSFSRTGRTTAAAYTTRRTAVAHTQRRTSVMLQEASYTRVAVTQSYTSAQLTTVLSPTLPVFRTLAPAVEMDLAQVLSLNFATPLPTHGRYRGVHDSGIMSTGLTKDNLTVWDRDPRTGFVDGTTYTRIYFPQGARPQASNLTFVECLFEANGGQSALSLQDGAFVNRSFTRCTIDGQNWASTSFGTLWGGPGVFRNCELLGGFDNIRGGDNLTMEDCYFHDPVRHPDSHTDIYQTLGGNNQRFTRCRFGDGASINAAVQLGQLTSTSTNVLFEDNYFQGNTNFTISYNPTGSAVSGYVFRRNRFGSSPAPQFGALHSDVSSRNNGTIFDIDASNVWDEDDVAVTTRNTAP